MSPEEILRNLEEAKKLADASQSDINKFINITTEQVLKTISEIYADNLLSMESDGFREIQQAVSLYTTRLAVDLDNIVFNNQV